MNNMEYKVLYFYVERKKENWEYETINGEYLEEYPHPGVDEKINMYAQEGWRAKSISCGGSNVEAFYILMERERRPQNDSVSGK